MTPKEKAVELVEKYRAVRIFGLCTEDPEVDAKQCALIAVEEIQKQHKIIELIDGSIQETEKHAYWQEVKLELEKL